MIYITSLYITYAIINIRFLNSYLSFLISFNNIALDID